MNVRLRAVAGLALLLASVHPSVAGEAPTHGASMPHDPAMSHAAEGRHAHGDSMERVAAPREPGQSAFAAISEIVAILRADPHTDWTKVDIEALRRHLTDMDNVTLRAAVRATSIAGGTRFEATSADPAVTASIRRMVTAHAATMSGYEGMEMRAVEIPGGAALAVTGGNAAMVRGLGFIGLLTVGMHHQEHHLSLARGSDPHRH